jgi:hypothetical protein
MANVPPEHFDDSIGPVGWSLIAVIFIFVFWKVWPEMKGNNIFSGNRPDHYALSKAEKGKRANIFPNALMLSVLFCLRDICLFLLQNKRPIGHQFFFPDNPRNPFFSSLPCFLAAYVSTFIDGADFSQFRDFRFAARSWLTAILIGTVCLSGYNLLRGVVTDNAIDDFFFNARLIQDAGIIILVAIVCSTNYFSRKTWKIAKKKKFILIYTGLAWAATTIILYMLCSSGLLTFVCLLFAVVLAGCLLFYRMTTVIYSDETSYVTESIDDVHG